MGDHTEVIAAHLSNNSGRLVVTARWEGPADQLTEELPAYEELTVDAPLLTLQVDKVNVVIICG